MFIYLQSCNCSSLEKFQNCNIYVGIERYVQSWYTDILQQYHHWDVFLTNDPLHCQSCYDDRPSVALLSYMKSGTSDSEAMDKSHLRGEKRYLTKQDLKTI